MENDWKILERICLMFILVIISTILIITILNKFYPQPTFKEVCEANNGTYIDNNGRAGDSCIYNK
jgi:hypothetical protein